MTCSHCAFLIDPRLATPDPGALVRDDEGRPHHARCLPLAAPSTITLDGTDGD